MSLVDWALRAPMFSLLLCFMGPLIHPWDGAFSPISPLLTAPSVLEGQGGTAIAAPFQSQDPL